MEYSGEISVQSLSKTYGIRKRIQALDHVSFSVPRGKCAALVGANGAGKTTLLSILGGALPRYDGVFRVNGRVGLCPEFSIFFPLMDATENVEYFSKTVGGADSGKISEILGELNLVPKGQLSNTFSKGMKRKLDIARALSIGASIILMDEPFDGLDPTVSSELVEIINRLKFQGITFIVSSHDLYRVAEVADTVFFLKSGKLIEEYELNNRNRFTLTVEGKTSTAEESLVQLGCSVINVYGSSLDFESKHGSKPWEIIAGLIAKGVKITGFSEQKLESVYRRVLNGA